MKKEHTTIEKIIELFIDKIEDGIRSVSEHVGSESRIIIGYNLLAMNSNQRFLDSALIDCNQVLKDYCKLLEGKALSVDTFNELVELAASSIDLETALRIAYLKHHSISIPNFPNFKLEKLVEAYEFPDGTIDLIGEIHSRSSFLTKEHIQYFNPKSNQFEISAAQAQEFKDKFAIYMSREQMAKILNLVLVTCSLNNLKIEGGKYSFNQLPDIGHHVLKYFPRESMNPTKELELDMKKIKEELNISDATQMKLRIKIKSQI